MPLPFILAGLTGPGLIEAIINNQRRKRDDLNKQISRLKKKLGKAKSRRPGNLLGAPQKPASVTVGKFEKGIERVGIRSEDDNFEILVSKAEDPGKRDWDTSRAKIDRLNPLVSALPLAGIAKHVSGTNYMIVEASGPLTPAKGGGYRAYVQGPDGKIRDHARLHSSELGKVVTPAVIWTAASFIVAQKHLHDISQELGKISTKIQEISDFQQNDRLSGITGDYRYLVELVERFKNSPEAMRDKSGVVEEIYRKTLHAEDHLLTDIRNVSIDPEDMEITSAELDKLTRLIPQIFLCFRIKIQCFLLQEMFTPDPHTTTDRLGKLRAKVSDIPPLVYEKFDCFFDRQASAWDAFEERNRVNQEIKAFSKTFETSFEQLAASYNDMPSAAHSIASQKQQILLKMDGERIVGISDSN